MVALWRVQARYRALFGSRGGEGWHKAVPDAAMQHLQSTFRVSLECFASPFNARLSLFCSLYRDTDVPFGSLGSFFDLDLVWLQR